MGWVGVKIVYCGVDYLDSLLAEVRVAAYYRKHYAFDNRDYLRRLREVVWYLNLDRHQIQNIATVPSVELVNSCWVDQLSCLRKVRMNFIINLPREKSRFVVVYLLVVDVILVVFLLPLLLNHVITRSLIMLFLHG